MKLEFLNCPRCDRKTLQGQVIVPTWVHAPGANHQSSLTGKVTVCSVCGSYIQRLKVLQEKCFDPKNYSLD